MKKKIRWAYFILFVSLMTLLSLPKGPTERVRGMTIAFMAPSWQSLLTIKKYAIGWFPSFQAHSYSSDEEIQKLRLDNALLQRELNHVKESVQREFQLLNEIVSKYPKEKEEIKQLKERKVMIAIL